MRNVLITGGTGSFGRAFVEKLLPWHHGKIAVYSRGELAQANMATEFKSQKNLRFFLGDIRDVDRLTWAMHDYDTIIHAAALKRIEVGHYNPEEMVKTNVLGTMNVVAAARNAAFADSRHVVMLSTDKACMPISPYGTSKALAEEIVLGAQRTRSDQEPNFCVTRYGNVAGSAGSVIPVWREQLARKDWPPLTITDPDCTRFWMSMPQALELVYQAAYKRETGLIAPLDLPAYRLGDLAAAMNPASGTTLVTGLPDYEKKHESMFPFLASNEARRMTIDELREALKHV